MTDDELSEIFNTACIGEALVKFARAVQKAERVRCAKVCRELYASDYDHSARKHGAVECANWIEKLD